MAAAAVALGQQGCVGGRHHAVDDLRDAVVVDGTRDDPRRAGEAARLASFTHDVGVDGARALGGGERRTVESVG